MKLKKRRKGRVLAVFLFLLGILLIGGSVTYTIYSSPVDKEDKEEIEVIIPSGMTTINIAKVLESKGLIRNGMFFRIYLKLNGIHSLKADVYLLKKNMTMDQIARTLEQGSNYNPDTVTITFQEGKNIRQIAKILASKTTIQEDVFLEKMKDRTYIQSLFDSYWFLSDTILQEDIYYPLEGYLAPDTYQFASKDVTIEEVVTKLLDQMEKNLEGYKTQLASLNVHEVLTLASMAELEGNSKEDRAMIVGVFQNRLAANMNLGSDVTTYYAFQEDMTQDLTSTMFNTYHPYNTRSSKMAGRLPIGPICNPDLTSIEAAISPKTNDYYYFVADKNGNIFYTKTEKEHLAKVQEIKDKGDWIW